MNCLKFNVFAEKGNIIEHRILEQEGQWSRSLNRGQFLCENDDNRLNKE